MTTLGRKSTRWFNDYSDLITELYVVRRYSPKAIANELTTLTGRVAHSRPIECWLERNHLLEREGNCGGQRHGRPYVCKMCDETFVYPQPSKFCSTCCPTLEDKWRAAKYGLSKAQYDELLRIQGNACAICERSFEGMKQQHIHVDHDHETHHVRGVLCMMCNMFVGYIEGQRFEKAMKYLQRAKESQR